MFALQTRRTFLKNALCVTAGAAVVPGCGMGGPSSVTEVTSYLVGLLRYPEEARKIGSSYLSADKAIKSLSPRQLTAVILEEIGVDNLDAPGVRLEKIGNKVKNKVRQDFTDETVVTVNGWLLSQTEARMCALVHLSRISKS
jgi:hypothetical protein